ncbi:hypothetical protein R1sor_019257 [Riccia sorocarpa]|uniref:NB-ARC domain-containing protein n=1 Tax=Riccia sorocarpa TaxID=122646 RepID=A0ABD3IC04_9MARC
MHVYETLPSGEATDLQVIMCSTEKGLFCLMDFSKKQESIIPGLWRHELEVESTNPAPTGAPNSSCHDDEMRKKGRELNEASTSNCHLRQSSQEGIQQISDGIHSFYVPEPKDNASLDVFFFHGLECEFEGGHIRDAHISSWKSRGGAEEIWPQKWLPEDFPRARIMSICYDCCMTQTSTEGRLDLDLIAENLLQEITWAREGRDYTPIVLVGHGFGGIVMKTLCLRAQSSVSNKDMHMFLESVRGFFFYSTPHLGIQGMKPPAATEGPLVKWMRTLNSESARLNDTFTKVWRARRYRWTIFSLGEIESTSWKQGLRVPEASARFGDDNYITVSGNHFFVCRPSNKSDNKYQHLTKLIREVQCQAEVERNSSLLVPKHTVGVDALINDILGEHMRDHRFVGFSGMGGVGKTTLAKLIFNRICAKFEFSCFVEEVKQFTGTNDEIKEKFWKRMRHRGVSVGSSSGSSGGDLWSQVSGKSLFLVFDDVVDVRHVTLLKEVAHENGMEESRFVLTSRDTQCLVDCGDDVHTIRVDFLGSQDAKKLFTTYAFPGKEEPPERFRELVERIVDGCQGLPLTLEVLGKYLRGKKFELWDEIPTALRKCDEVAGLQGKVWGKLRLSYDGLPSEKVRNMFLDIASFFIYNNTFLADDAIMAWSAIHGGIVHSRLQILEERGLVTVRHHQKDGFGEDWKEFYMHEHLRRMGQKIARSEGRSFDLSPRSSLSTSLLKPPGEEEEAEEYPYDDDAIFKGEQELGRIVAHRVGITKHSLSICGQTCAFCVMRELWPRLTVIRYMQVYVEESSFCNECKIRRVALPSTLVLVKVTLSRYANRNANFAFSAEAGRIYIDDTRSTLSLTRCASLVKLDLKWCHNVDLGGLNELRCMRDLSISMCNAVQNWPASLEELRNSERLELWSITEPFQLPITFGDLTSLQHLSISRCKVSSIPSSLRKLTSLQFLEVDEIIGRQTVPNIIGPFRQLQVLRMKCWAIAELADAVRELVALRELYLDCPGILGLPDTLGNLTNLRLLTFDYPIRSLPTSLSNLTQLEKVNLTGDFGRVFTVLRDCCVTLRDGDEAVRDSFQHLRGFMTNQTKLRLGCTRGSSTVIVRNMINLESLVINVDGEISTDAVAAVPDIFGDLRKLQILELTCDAVENSLVESLRLLSSLEKLCLDCVTVEHLPLLFGCYSTLKTLRIRCPSLHSLPVKLGNFIKLKEVDISDTGLRSFPKSFTKLSNLQSLSLRNLQKLEMLPEDIGNLQSVDSLDIWNCAIERLPETIGDLCSLRTLRFSGSSLHTLPESLGRLSGLTSLELTNCENLKTLPETIRGLSSLASLDLSGSSLHSLPESLGRLSGLTSLEVAYCWNLKTLPETIGDLTNLESLDISDSALHSLPERLGLLRDLEIYS